MNIFVQLTVGAGRLLFFLSLIFSIVSLIRILSKNNKNKSLWMGILIASLIVLAYEVYVLFTLGWGFAA